MLHKKVRRKIENKSKHGQKQVQFVPFHVELEPGVPVQVSFRITEIIPSPDGKSYLIKLPPWLQNAVKEGDEFTFLGVDKDGGR